MYNEMNDIYPLLTGRRDWTLARERVGMCPLSHSRYYEGQSI